MIQIKRKQKNAPSGTPSLPLVHSVPCAVMSTMVLAVSEEVGGSIPSAQGAACGAAGARRRRHCSAKDGSDDDDVEGAVEIDASSLDVAAAAVAAAAAVLGTTAAVEHLEADAAADGVDTTRALSWAAKADICCVKRGKTGRRETVERTRERHILSQKPSRPRPVSHSLSLSLNRFVFFPLILSSFHSSPSMSLADLERSLLSRLEASGELSRLRSSARDAALKELDGLSSSSSSASKTKTSRGAKPPLPTPPAETVVALELVREFLDFHGFLKARSLLEAEADLPPCRGRRGGASFFGRRALASLVGVERGEEEEGEREGEEHGLRPPPLLYSVMAQAAAAAASRKTRSEEER